MTTDTCFNGGRVVFEGGAVRSPAESERSGSIQAQKTTIKPAAQRQRFYTVTVTSGRLRVASLPRKRASEQG